MVLEELTTDPGEPKPVEPVNVKHIKAKSDFILELINTNGQASFSTDLINKKLDCIIVDTDDKAEIIVESELGYLIFHRQDHNGIRYYCIRVRTTTNTEKAIDYSDFEKYNLNERLIITVRSRKGQKIKLTFRFE